MAEALVGGAFLSAFLQVLFDRLASREVVDFFKTRKLNPKILNKLEITMISVNRVLDDVEEKQITNRDVKKWVTQLKDAVYDADDLLDQIAYEALKLKVEAGSETRSDQVQTFFSSINLSKKGLDFEARLEEIHERLEFLVKQKDVLGLKEGSGEKQLSKRTPTTSLVDDESGIFGRDADEKAIMEMVLQSESDIDASGNKLVVIPIVGMGGVGKTTLTQLVYSKTQQRFDLKAWVCVSEEKDPFVVTKHILKEVIGSLNCDGMPPNQLHVQLKSSLAGKKFLLVLDDVWIDSYVFWEHLQKPLKFGAQGSVILVTTRNTSVADVMGTVPAYCLKELDDDDSWFLFAKHAFANENSSARPDLEVVGKAIVKKCKGLPLATKTLGGLLRKKRDVNEWKNILKSNLWDLPDGRIIPPLWLSYYYLPSHLKQCFAYCALFPKDYVFKKKELILLWMAEGFLVPIEGDKEMEEVGDQYFQDLVSRSFFSQHSWFERMFVMHDLLHDLAESVSEKFYLKLEDDHSGKITKHTRHLSSIREWHITSKTFAEVCNAVVLRTVLLVLGKYNKLEVNVEMVNDLKPKLKQLRVLSLSNFPHVGVMSDLISGMKYLQCLNLRGTNIEVLPESIQNFYNLQILILRDCSRLIELPNMKKLINLFHLDIRGTHLMCMPLQMGQLTKLRKLSYFIVGEQNGSNISELGELKHLRGKFEIRNLQNVTKPQYASDAKLKDKEHLKKLTFEWSKGGDTNDSLHEREVLEQLQPHTNTKCLTIHGYGGTRLAVWVGDSSFSSMISLTIEGCKNCLSLPPVGQLPSLKSLKISGFDAVITVDSTFYGSSERPFPSLERLIFEEMPQWEEWIPFAKDDGEDEGGAFPFLQELCILNCPNLKKSLPSHLPCLTTLNIGDCHDQILTSLPRAPQLFSFTALPSLDYQMGQMRSFSATIEEIRISYCNSVMFFPLELCPKLKRLSIWGSENLESLVGVENMHGNFTSPESLQITELELWYCSSLKSLPKRMQSLLPFLESLTIIECPEVEWFSEGGLPSKLQSICIKGCKKLVAGYKQWNLQLLSSLSFFFIEDIDDVECFPEKMLLPSTLSVLRISRFKDLKFLDYEGLQHLTNLKILEILDCDKLQCLPEEGLPSSLHRLGIHRCPLLEQRCERDGEDGPKIAHIPDVNMCPILYYG